MSTSPDLIAAIKAESKSTNVRSLAQGIGEPQRAALFDAETQSPEQDLDKTQTTEANLAAQDLTAFSTWQTRVKIFLLSTGGDVGSHAEIRVRAGIEGYPIASASTDLPLHTSFANENGGLGHELAH